ncbi:unnamed protein product, partial [Didymodactylos carnosus]
QTNRTNRNSNNRQNPHSIANIVGISAEGYYDSQSNVYGNSRDNQQQNRIPPPTATNLRVLDSPSRSPYRRTRTEQENDDEFQTVTNNKRQRQLNNEFVDQFDDQQQKYNNHYSPPQLQQQIYNNNNNYRPLLNSQQQPLRTIPSSTSPISNRSQQNQLTGQQQSQEQQNRISSEAARYAQTRFPFQPFIIRFSSGDVKDKQAAQELSKHFKENHRSDVSIANIRRSTLKCQQNEYDLLIYVKDSSSFTSLFRQQNWPQQIGGEKFMFPSTPSFPSQLSFIIKNVDLRTNFDDFSDDLKTTYPEIHSVIRLKNKHQNSIKLIKIEILSATKREEILTVGKIIVNSMTFDVEEYLAPANVLICSKCMAIGHFKKQCTQVNETCKICGTSCADLLQHNCTMVSKCIHCDGDHNSNALKCPVVKNFRAELTK